MLTRRLTYLMVMRPTPQRRASKTKSFQNALLRNKASPVISGFRKWVLPCVVDLLLSSPTSPGPERSDECSDTPEGESVYMLGAILDNDRNEMTYLDLG